MMNGLRRPWWVALAVAAVVMLAACSGSGSSTPVKSLQAAASASTPPDEQAAGGPLVGNPDLISGEQSCVAAEANAPWYPTIAAFEVHDSNRTHLYDCAHFTGSMTASNQVFAYSSPQDYPTPYNIVDHGPNELFIYGHHIAKLDPATGDILVQTTLPTGASAPGDTAYNGYDAFPDGTIIAKTVNREKGCTEQGFSAFLDCPHPSQVPPSVMVAINPKTLKVIAQITLPQMIGGRITTTVYHGKDEIYLPGTSKLYRYTYHNGSFALDSSWGPVPYLKSGQTAGSAMAVLGNYVVTMTNGQPTSTPMSVVAVSQADAKQIANLEPFASSGAKNSLIPSMVSVDPQNNRVYVMDAGAGKLAGVNLQNGKLSVAWTQDQTTLSFTTLIGPKSQRVLIGTNIQVKTFQGLKHYTTEQVIWRNAQTGSELASSSQFPKMTQGILVTPGYAGLQYFLTADGHIIALQVTPKH